MEQLPKSIRYDDYSSRLRPPELQEKLKGHVKGDTGIVGLFQHP
jgi:hypothetical protein